MLRTVGLLFTLAVLPLTFAGSGGDGDVTLEGSFIWNREDGDQTGDLKAVFTPTGKNEWTVAFHFVWEDEPHVYEGTASGSLSKGKLEGSAKADDPDHMIQFRFFGKVKDGTFTGTHGFVRDDELTEAGTLTLGPKS